MVTKSSPVLYVIVVLVSTTKLTFVCADIFFAKKKAERRREMRNVVMAFVLFIDIIISRFEI